MTKKALIIGPAYNSPYQIQTTVNDIANWNSTLQNYRGFSLITIISGLISRAAMLQALQAFKNSIAPSDSGVVVLLGHGARMRGNEPDGYDECWVSSYLEVVRDHEIGAILGASKIDFVSEFCYAGTSTDNPSVRTWAACGPAQISYGCMSGGVAYALFSLYLCWALRVYPTKTAAELMVIVRYYVMRAAPSQVPQLDGNNQGQNPF